MLINQHFFLLLLIASVCAYEYDSNHTLQCSTINDSWTYDQNL